MKLLKVYFETSVFNFAFADDSPVEKDITLKLFNKIKDYEAYISEIVIREISRAPEFKKKQLFNLINKYEFKELEFDRESEELAKWYIKEGVIPEKYEEDAFHIAIASVNNLDVLISWNFSHIVKLKTKMRVVGINRMLGYKEIEIVSPWEVVKK
jgi:predicted nucleic acid-binding protein